MARSRRAASTCRYNRSILFWGSCTGWLTHTHTCETLTNVYELMSPLLLEFI